MFGKFLSRLQEGSRISEVLRVLSKTYSLNVSDTVSIEDIKFLIEIYGDMYGPQEIALKFVVDLIGKIRPDHPKARPEIERLIKVAKGAYRRGLIDSNVLLDSLCDTAFERFGIDANNIPAV